MSGNYFINERKGDWKKIFVMQKWVVITFLVSLLVLYARWVYSKYYWMFRWFLVFSIIYNNNTGNTHPLRTARGAWTLCQAIAVSHSGVSLSTQPLFSNSFGSFLNGLLWQSMLQNHFWLNVSVLSPTYVIVYCHILLISAHPTKTPWVSPWHK